MTVSESATDSLYAPQEISTEVLLEKYAKGNETSVEEVMERVAQALAEVEAPKNKKNTLKNFCGHCKTASFRQGASAVQPEPGLQTTLINCFVQPVGDSITNMVDGKPGHLYRSGSGSRNDAQRRGCRL